MIFEKKKIQIETLGEYLTEVRNGFNYTQEYVAGRVSIQVKYLKNLELGNFKDLPADAYTVAFIKKIAVVYNLDSNLLIEQFKKEKNIHCQLQNKQTKIFSFKNQLFGRFVLTPKILIYSFGGLFFLVSLSYIIWQVFSINKLPNLSLLQPKDRELVVGTFVVVNGTTDPGMNVFVNNQPIFVENSGKFQTQVGINSGPKEIEIKAENRFGKTTIKKITVVGSSDIGNTEKKQFELIIKFLGDVNYSYSVDDAATIKESSVAGYEKKIFAKTKVTLSSSDAALTEVYLNGKTVGVLGRRGEKIENLSFYSDGVK